MWAIFGLVFYYLLNNDCSLIYLLPLRRIIQVATLIIPMSFPHEWISRYRMISRLNSPRFYRKLTFLIIYIVYQNLRKKERRKSYRNFSIKLLLSWINTVHSVHGPRTVCMFVPSSLASCELIACETFGDIYIYMCMDDALCTRVFRVHRWIGISRRKYRLNLLEEENSLPYFNDLYYVSIKSRL